MFMGPGHPVCVALGGLTETGEPEQKDKKAGEA